MSGRSVEWDSGPIFWVRPDEYGSEPITLTDEEYADYVAAGRAAGRWHEWQERLRKVVFGE